MFPHRAMRYSPFKMLYRREAIWSEELPYIIYNCDETYHEAVGNHIIKRIKINEAAIKKN